VPTDGAADHVRLDRWLWAARFFKTRSLASAACSAGRVKLGGSALKPARAVRPGDELEIFTPGGRRLVGVLELAQIRGPAEAARRLYDDRTPPEPPPDERHGVAERERGLGRPSKRDRRRLGRLRGR